MARPLPRLRLDLDLMPSPAEDRPGLLMRDSQGYTGAMLIVPPPLVACLELYDGESTDLDMKQLLFRITGDLDNAHIEEQLTQALDEAGFLQNERFQELMATAHREFRESAVREPAHAGTAYPDSPEEARGMLDEYMTDAPASSVSDKLIGIAAPHVSPFGGWQTYRAAYSALDDRHRERTFVILGTSHAGEPDAFGLTRKPYSTPLGEAVPDLALINELAAEPAARMEDYCHRTEHSIEFQVLYLQHRFGPNIRIVPLLCGSFARSICDGGLPEDNEHVKRFLANLGEVASREADKLVWVLGIDMAHMGARYGDPFEAQVNEERMTEVERRDRSRIASVVRGDRRSFWEQVQENGDDLKWCGSSPLYTFLSAVPNARGTVRGYEQWNIDDASVVSFAALEFGQA
ncbi:MAG TPA: AmmeMemoRadiSam system protein B [Bryobacteraceae bacterium]|nr:AmmeMemoRadiSam system protein B [Bryobacteraceae bacterium]